MASGRAASAPSDPPLRGYRPTVIVRLLLWNLFDSQTTLGELRQRLPQVEPPSAWISNVASERFGLVLFGEPPDGLDEVERLIGRPADVAEEFDVE